MDKITSLDPQQISRYVYDEDKNANRVVLVGGEILIPEVKFPDNIKIDNKIIEIIKEVPVIIRDIQIKEVEKIIVVEKFIQVVTEVPVIKEVIVWKEIEKPVIVKETEFRTIKIDNPVIITQEKLIDKIPAWCYSVMIGEAIALICLILQSFKK